MSKCPSDDYVGYGKPPKHTRWKKGESGNPGKKYPRKPKNTATLIHELFMSSIEITVDGKRRKVTFLEAIMMQLYKLEISGNRQALRTRQAYETFAFRFVERKVETVFVENDYTRLISANVAQAEKCDGGL